MGVVKAVYTLRHRLHHPERELEGSSFQEPFEHPGRAETIRAALAADDRFELVAPDEWGQAPIAAVHDPGLVAFLETAWHDYQIARGPTHDVIPDVFAMPALREGMGPATEPAPIVARLGWWCFETTTPIMQTTYEAARSSVDVALSAAALVTGGERFAYGLCRPPGHHAARAAYGGYCFFNNAAIVAHHLASHDGVEGDGARRRLPPRQRHPADLLRARRRAVRLIARRPGPGLSVRDRSSRRDRCRAGESARRRTSRSRSR